MVVINTLLKNHESTKALFLEVFNYRVCLHKELKINIQPQVANPTKGDVYCDIYFFCLQFLSDWALLQKVEELTLYLIEMNAHVNAANSEVTKLNSLDADLEKENASLKATMVKLETGK
jgi:hypothetical protein